MQRGGARAAMLCRVADPRTIRRLIGVYDADGTLRGELSYWVGARFGRAHCALCDVTHSTFRERADWRSCRAGLRVPFDTCHRNDQPAPVRAAAGGAAPVVVAETDTGMVVLLWPDDLERCQGSPERLVAAIDDRAGAAGLTWP
jgi:hypothetical protein